MSYLFDVNALIALGFVDHEFHTRVAAWVAAGQRQIATCAITELGFIRVLSNTRPYGLTVPEAIALLSRLKSSNTAAFRFIVDNMGAADLPRWVKNSEKITDGHLMGLADSNQSTLATLDANIPGAFLIPDAA